MQPETPSKVNPPADLSGTKSIFTSRVVAGVLLGFLPLIAKKLGYELSDADSQATVEYLFQTVGGGMAIWGRWKASKRATILPANPTTSASLLLLIGVSLIATFYLSACATDTRAGRVTNAVAITAGKFAGRVVLSSVANLASDKAKGLQLDYAHAASEGLWENVDTIITADDLSRIVKAWSGPAPADLAPALAAQYAVLSPTTPDARSAVVAAMAKGISDAALALGPDQLLPLPQKGGLAK